ncbi:MAG: D-amino acid aminotransferase [Rhodocyclaceae bacterium]|nr:D-amino acid aminotransferase [Rhodocyclaceae bacterium]
MSPICHLDGQFLPLAEARVSPMDRGFLFGDGGYEVIPVYSRRPFRLDEHLARLDTTLAALELDNPHGREAWRGLVATLIERNAWDDQSIYLQVTRGTDTRRNHAFPEHVRPTVFMMSEALVTVPEAQRASGVGAITAADFRWLRCDLKTTALLANCLLRNAAVKSGCVEAILLRDGFLTEGSASNIFIVRDGVVMTPPKSHLMLPGITYDVVLEVAASQGQPHEVREILEEELRTADEIWMTSSTKEVLPITRLDDRPVGDGRPGPVARRMHQWYQEFKAKVMRGG